VRPTNIRVNPLTICRHRICSSAHNGPKRRRRITVANPLFIGPSASVHRTLIVLLLPITDGTEAAVASSALREPFMIEITMFKSIGRKFRRKFVHLFHR